MNGKDSRSRPGWEVHKKKARLAAVSHHGSVGRSADGHSSKDLLSPLMWWRRIPAYEFSSFDIPTATRALQRLAIAGEPRWSCAHRRDAGDDIGAALRTLKRHGPQSVAMDLAMTAVLCSAIGGDPAAADLMAAVLRSRSAIDRHCEPLSLAWTAAGFESLVTKSRRKEMGRFQRPDLNPRGG
jgi:hypothetical protein